MGKYTRILSIDGGGIRGIIPAQILVSLEEKIQAKTNNQNAHISDYFDFIAGTSTGGILTCIYLYPDPKNPLKSLFSAEDAISLYLQHGGEIFKSNIWQKIKSIDGYLTEKYSAKNLEGLLLTYFKDVKLSEALKPCIITSYDISNRDTHFFTQQDAKTKPGYDYYLRDVARATAAAPTYFSPALITSMSGVQYPLIDGGVFADNPSLCAYAEARQVFKKLDGVRGVTANDMFILSIGTGEEKTPYEYKKAKDWGNIGWVQPVLDIMLSGPLETVDYQLYQVFDSDDASSNYIRIMPDIGSASDDMDDASESNLINLKNAGIAAAKEYDIELDAAVDKLLE